MLASNSSSLNHVLRRDAVRALYAEAEIAATKIYYSLE
jgi:hypothetical protein